MSGMLQEVFACFLSPLRRRYLRNNKNLPLIFTLSFGVTIEPAIGMNAGQKTVWGHEQLAQATSDRVGERTSGFTLFPAYQSAAATPRAPAAKLKGDDVQTAAVAEGGEEDIYLEAEQAHEKLFSESRASV